MDPLSADANPGEEFTVTLKARSDEGVSGITVKILYDPEQLELTSPAPINVLTPMTWYLGGGADIPTAGVITITRIRGTGGELLSGEFDIASIGFKIKAGAVGPISISVDDASTEFYSNGERVNNILSLPTTLTFAESAGTGVFTLRSSAFEDGGNIPSTYTCDNLMAGSEVRVNPPFTIENIPAGTQSLVLIVEDVDAVDASEYAGGSSAYVHWLVFNINPDGTVIEENSVPLMGIQGHNSLADVDNGGSFYIGPCPPIDPIQESHRYTFNLYAVDQTFALTGVGAIDQNMDGIYTASEVRGAMGDFTTMGGHIIAQTTLRSFYYPRTIACGDGVVDAEESCDDWDILSDDGCSSGCSIEPGWSCENPRGRASECTAVPASCGNGAVDEDETCSSCPADAACTGDMICIEGACMPSPICGDGVVDAGEECDGVIPADLSCSNFQSSNGIFFTGGTLIGCNTDCTLNTALCTLREEVLDGSCSTTAECGMGLECVENECRNVNEVLTKIGTVLRNDTISLLQKVSGIAGILRTFFA